MFITNNHASFHLWLKKNLLKHQKVSKYYEHCTVCSYHVTYAFQSDSTPATSKNRNSSTLLIVSISQQKFVIRSYKYLINISQNSHKFQEFFNRDRAKASYSSLPYFASIIKSHNKKILRQEEIASPKPHCNCRVKESFPLNGDCLQSSVCLRL